MSSTISSVEDFDTALFEEYARVVGYFPNQSESFIQQRFAQYAVFPKLGWGLIGVGEAQALSNNDPAMLYATISRFIKCAHACWGTPDEQGLHWGGYDFCSLVVPALYSALLGKTYVAAAFRCDRPMSNKGYGAFKHAANLMVCLECKTWKHREKAVNQAVAFVAAKSSSKTDRAFISIFLGILADDTARVLSALDEFSDGYSKSDWGRHKPVTKPTFIHALIVFAHCYLTTPVDEQSHRSLIGSERLVLWQEYERRLAEFVLKPHQFTNPLSFLNEARFSSAIR